MREGNLSYRNADASVVRLKVDSDFKMAGDVFFASGLIGKNSYALKGSLADNEMEIKKFEFTNDHFHWELWGKASTSFAQLKGFLFIYNTGLIKKPKPDILFILDIDSQVKFDFPAVEIERLNFAINNNPVKLNAKLNFAKPFSGEIYALTDFKSLENKEEDTLKNITLKASWSAEGDNALKVQSSLNIDFPEQKKEPLPVEKMALTLKDLTLPLSPPRVLNLQAAELGCICKTSANSYKVRLEDLHARIYGLDKNSKFITFASACYNGSLKGKSQYNYAGSRQSSLRLPK